MNPLNRPISRILFYSFTGFILVLGAASAIAAPTATAFVDVNVIPMNEETVLAHQTVLVEGGVISQIGAVSDVVVPEGTQVIDAQGQYLIPGLHDMHVHLNGGRRNNPIFLKQYLANGVTTVLCLKGNKIILDQREEVRAGTIPGPDIFTTGPIVAQMGADPQTYDEGKQVVKDQVAEGYDYIKVYNEVPAEAYEGIMDQADEMGVTVIGHAVRSVGIEGALRRKQDVVHLEEFIYGYFGKDLDEARIPELVAKTKASGISVTATLVAYHTILDQVTDLNKALDNPATEYVPAPILTSWRERNEYRKNFDMDDLNEYLAPSCAFIEKLTKAFQDAGVPLMAGTDAIMPVVVPGFSIYRELEYLVAAGLSPYEALATATRTPAEYLGRGASTGTIEKGKEATFILVDANPLEDIAHARKRAGVIQRGNWMNREALDAMLYSTKPKAG